MQYQYYEDTLTLKETRKVSRTLATLRKMAKELVNDEYFLDSVEFVFNSRRKR